MIKLGCGRPTNLPLCWDRKIIKYDKSEINRRYCPTTMPNNHAQHPLRLLATSCTSQIRHPGFSTFLYESVKILAPLTPMSSHKAEQWSIALQPRHKSANLTRLGACQASPRGGGRCLATPSLSCLPVSLSYQQGISWLRRK